jgi:hypothetical protein
VRNLVLFAAIGFALAGCDRAAEEADEPMAPAASEAATTPSASETVAEDATAER